MVRTIKAQYRAGYTDYDGLATYRVMPTRNVPIDALEPFIFLNHHGPQTYRPNNSGLPFGPHPHKGFETVTFVVEGDIVHADSTGYNSTIGAGGVQWMTAGRGIIHSEGSSDLFKEQGGSVEVLQLWVNLPAALKNAAPAYTGLQQDAIPQIEQDGGKVLINLISGRWENQQAPIQSLSDVHLSTIAFTTGGRLQTAIPAERVVLFYVIRGHLTVNGEQAATHELVEFNNDGAAITIEATSDSLILLGHALPNQEPIAAHGPFVMNTQEEIRQAFLEYQQGKLGEWKH